MRAEQNMHGVEALGVAVGAPGRKNVFKKEEQWELVFTLKFQLASGTASGTWQLAQLAGHSAGQTIGPDAHWPAFFFHLKD